MKYLLPVMAALCCPMMAFCQDITGLWKGTIYNDSTKQSLEYEIVISKEKGKFTGYSHTSYVINGTQYYGVKKINVRIAKDGKIVMQDAKWIENNYSSNQHKNVIQLNVLDLASAGEQHFMDGLFVTNQSKGYQALTGRISLKKEDPLLAQAQLKKYLQANDDNLTAVK
ncbi:MAG: hypothetical protein JNM14_14285 [Ferruginibacter sp.]|nr:hypothetical protein [Ferruginibacter sp.]